MRSHALFLIGLAASLGFINVAIGAFGAHAWKNILVGEHHSWFQTSLQYSWMHTFALLFLASWSQSVPTDIGEHITPIAIAFVSGIFLFSGSLLALAFTGVRWLGAITPLGGVLFLIGWFLLARLAWISWKNI